jgi:gliding motility-associated-like protein/uncharacterized repeat protein (TIGR01451 family)
MKSPLTGLFVLLFLLLSYQGRTQFTINNSFMTNDETGIIRGGGAKLTSGLEDAVNMGWLRLTSDTYDQSGYAYVNQPFPSTLGVLVEFDYSTWRSKTDVYNGADGITVFLFDAAVPIFKVGAFGGSLGYAPKSLENPPIDGLSGGYVGIGLDEYGNYSNPTEGRVGGVGFKPNSIGLRGPASSNYAYITSTQLVGTSIQAGQYAVRPTSQQFYRRVQVEIKPVAGTFRIIVSLKTSPTGKFAKVFEAALATPPPPNLKLGFAASTGSAINNHEIRNLRITTPGNVSIEQTVDKLTPVKGDKMTYTLIMRNDSDDPAIGLPVVAEIRDCNGNLVPTSLFTIDDITFNDGGYAGNKVSAQPSKTNPFSAVVELEAHSAASFIITGTLKGLPPGGCITSNAEVRPESAQPAAIPDIDLSNNKSAVISQVSGGELTVTKAALAGPYTKVGDVINYNIVVKNTGNAVISSIVLTDANADAGSITPSSAASLALGASFTATAKHTVTQADVDKGSVSNLAKADGRDPNNIPVHGESTDPTPLPGVPVDPACIPCTVTPITQAPALEVKKVATELTFRETGEIIHYTITVKNTGSVTLNTVLVTDPLTGLNQTIATLAPGATQTLTTTYTITAADLDNGLVDNTVTAAGKTPGGQTITQTAKATVTFVSSEGGAIFIPNVITPNADGKNDQFRILRLNKFPNSELMIFNRWGNMVYRSANYQNDWDGKGLNEGTYYYALLLNTPTGKIKHSGWVQLLR